MRFSWLPLCDLACLALLHAGSLLVPRRMRRDWVTEWRSELWYARQTYTRASTAKPAEVRLLCFCWGAFEDARSLSKERTSIAVVLANLRGSPQGCTACLVMLLALSAAIGLSLSNVRSHLRPSHVSAQGLVLIQDTLSAQHGNPTLSASQFLDWKNRRQRIFQDFAFYRLRSASFAEANSAGSHAIRVAYATENVFDVAGLSLKPLGERHAKHITELNGIVLSHQLWQDHFHSQSTLVGRTIQLGSGVFIVQAIAPVAATELPGHPDAWILSTERSLKPEQKGFVLGRLNPSFREAPWGDGWQMTAPLPDGSTSDFTCLSLLESLHQPWDLFVFSVLLAILALPATTSLPLGEYRSGHRSLSRTSRLRRWAFLVCKLCLVLGIVYCSSIDLAFARERISSNAADYLQIVSCFGLCLWGLRWTLRDQRQRCPVCLGKLTNPARVGHPSRNFLAWNGTELICVDGHGLLHVPEISTSWFSTQRWLYLDASWQVLFSERGLVTSSYF